MGRAMSIDGKTTTLIGVGTSICGGSAIAATAPVIRAKDEDVAQAISTIFLFNIIAVFIFPPMGHLLGLSDTGFGMWAGTAINDTSSVVAAGASWSANAGSNTAPCLRYHSKAYQNPYDRSHNSCSRRNTPRERRPERPGAIPAETPASA